MSLEESTTFVTAADDVLCDNFVRHLAALDLRAYLLVTFDRAQHDRLERRGEPVYLRLLPQLKGVKIDYAWSGTFLLTLNRLPQFGRINANVYYAQGYSGHGVTCSHLAGRLIAEVLDGQSERFDAFAGLPHLPFPGGRTLSVPLTTLGAWYYRVRDALGV